MKTNMRKPSRGILKEEDPSSDRKTEIEAIKIIESVNYGTAITSHERLGVKQIFHRPK